MKRYTITKYKLMKIALCLLAFSFFIGTTFASGLTKKEKTKLIKKGFVIRLKGVREDYIFNLYLLKYSNSFSPKNRSYIQDYYELLNVNGTNRNISEKISMMRSGNELIFRDTSMSEISLLIPHISVFENGKYKETYADSTGLSTIYMEPGDSVTIDLRGNKINYVGNAAGKFEVSHDVELVRSTPVFKSTFQFLEAIRDRPVLTDSVKFYFNRMDSISLKMLDVIQKNRFLSFYDKTTLTVKVFSDNTGYKTSYWTIVRSAFNSCSSYMDSLNRIYKSPFSVNSQFTVALLKNEIATNHAFFLNNVLSQFQTDSCWGKNVAARPVAFYNFCRKYFSGQSRENLIFNYVRAWKNYANSETGQIVRRSLKENILPTKVVRQYFQNLVDSISIFPGQKAYNFNLISYDGSNSRLSDYEGKVVLMETWYVQCTPCMLFYPTVDSIANELKGESNFQLLSICTDLNNRFNPSRTIEGNREIWRTNVQKNLYTSEQHTNLLADPLNPDGREFIKKFQITGGPTVIIIDKFGRVVAFPISRRKSELLPLIRKLL